MDTTSTSIPRLNYLSQPSSRRTTRGIIRAAHWLSAIFRPQYFPLVGFVVLFWFTYLSLLPFPFKAIVIGLVLIGTVLFPRLGINLWRRARGWERHELRQREKRMVPYLIYILCYLGTYHALAQLHLPRYMGGILIGAFAIQVACTVINLWWKISTHTAAAGGAIGALCAFSFIFMFNPVWWLCLFILIAGLVGSSRMLLRQHDLWQVVGGSILGCLLGFLSILLS